MTEETINCQLNEKTYNKHDLSKNDAGSLNEIPCGLCPETFESVHLAIQHYYKKHPRSQKLYFCKFCGIQFPLKFSYDVHLNTHNNEKVEGEFKCNICHAVFLIEKVYKSHMLAVHNVILNADETTTVILREEDLKKLTQPIKSEMQSIPCDVCEQSFKTISLAIQHKYRKHPDAVKYFCRFCGMQFPLKSTYDKHLPLHNEDIIEGDFQCTECSAKFCTQKGRTYHTKSAHNRVANLVKPINTPPPSKKIRLNNASEAQSVYYCYLCGFPYINKFNLQRHLEQSHTEIERNNVPVDMLKCTTCDAFFYTKQAYDSHVIDHKPDDLYVTSEKQRLQTVARVDQDFDIRRVQLPTEKYIPAYKSSRKIGLKKSKFDVQKIKKEQSDDEMSPTSEIESSDDEKIIKNDIIASSSSNTSISEINSKYGIVKKKYTLIVDSKGEVTKTCSNIPQDAVITKTNVIKVKKRDILQSFKQSDKINSLKIIKSNLINGPTANSDQLMDVKIRTSETNNISGDVKIILDRLPDKYEKILRDIKNR